jgi:probable HAF family extracellular repeat protein
VLGEVASGLALWIDPPARLGAKNRLRMSSFQTEGSRPASLVGAGTGCRGLTAIAAVLVLLAMAAAGASGHARPTDGSGNAPTVRSPGFLLDNGRFATIEAPGARTHTYAHGINNRGQIAGGFDNPSVDGPDGRIHGVIRERGGRFVRFDVPGAMGTVANKINDRGEIVGGSLDSAANVGAPGSDGFLLRRGMFTKLRLPGSLETQALGINNRGRVVGEYVDPSGTFHGFLWHRGRFTTIDGPGTLGGAVFDINDRGQMVGAYLAADGSYRGFLLSRGRYTTFAAPGAPVTFPTDINNRGQIVGSGLSYDANRELTSARGFVLRKGIDGPFTQIDVPGALGTIPRGIDDRGRIVGLYANPNATPSPQPSAIQAMGAPSTMMARAG